MKRVKKVDNDQFYTKKDIAISLINKIKIKNYQLVIDPCCGDGSFYLNIDHQNKIAIDIDPKINFAIKSDFLEWVYSGDINRKSILCISNPPFGKQASLAIQFINKCTEFSDTIAFILPLSFKKNSLKNRIHKNYHLVYEEDLPKSSFIANGMDYDVPCVFQIWENKYTKRANIIEEKPFKFKYTNKENADISVRRVGYYAGKAFRDLNKSKQSHYFLKFDDDIDIDLIINKLNEIEFKQNTTGPKSISKGELNELINKLFKNMNIVITC